MQMIKSIVLFGALTSFGFGGQASSLVSRPASPARVAAWQTENKDPSADITGKWHFVYQTEGGDRDMSAEFKVNGEQVTGKYDKADVKGTYQNGVLDLAFPFTSEEAGTTATLKMKGKLENGKLVGNWEFADYNGTFTATRAQ